MYCYTALQADTQDSECLALVVQDRWNVIDHIFYIKEGTSFKVFDKTNGTLQNLLYN